MKKNIGHLTSEIFSLLDGLDKDECTKVLNSVSTLLGVNSLKQTQPQQNQPEVPNGNPNSSTVTQDAKDFFDLKQPKTKGEELAVAAKYRIDNDLGDTHSKEDFKTIIKTQAKHKFDERNFARDMDNAIRVARFFLKADGRGEYMLSNIGEKYVDALPDRSAANNFRKAKGTASKSKKVIRKKSPKQ